LLNPEGADSTSAGEAVITTTTLTLRSWPAAQIFNSFFSRTFLSLVLFSYFTLTNRTLIWRLVLKSFFLLKYKKKDFKRKV
jgi:hypothetical protein